MKIAIVDYGMGNIRSVISALKYIGVNDVTVTNDFSALKASDKLILPGVGNYASAIAKIEQLNLKEKIAELSENMHKPLLGICLGMQLLGKTSTENGIHVGLNLVDGAVDSFKVKGLKVPHVGFNQVVPSSASRLFDGLGGLPDFYFTHSFRMLTQQDIGQSYCSYGEQFVASYEKGNVAGVQFHPELSQTNGLKLLKNFIELF